ncbi:major facilitator superfamily domain-containing protein [Nemania abortiva]|nr:major facilitator superfamily domain-containing protein [Nemania abortiva]
MASMAVSSLLAGLDATAVSTAMPSIIHDLGASQGYVWIANAYLLTTAAFTPIFGQTVNIFGRNSLTIFAIVTFAIGSAIAGPAPSLGPLVVGRAIQGIGYAGLNTMVEMVVCDLVPLRERGKFMGLIFALYAISTTVGPLVGGASQAI